MFVSSQCWFFSSGNKKCTLKFHELIFGGVGNSISNHPGHDTLTSQNIFSFAPFAGIIEIWELWKLQLLTSSGSCDIAIWKIVQNTLSGPKFSSNFWSKGAIKLKFGKGKFFGMRSSKTILRIHKNKPVFSYFTF